jgi:hypothetical protein
MDTIFVFTVGIAALSGLLNIMFCFYLPAVSREMQSPDVDKVGFHEK